VPRPHNGSAATAWRSDCTGLKGGGGSVSLPAVDFHSANASQSGPLANRVDHNTSLRVPPLKKYRVRTITHELGGTVGHAVP